MEDLPVSLGVNPSETIAPGHGGPMSPGGDGDVVYPTFTYRGPLDLDLPEHGDMLIHYCQVDERSAGRPSGERYYECTIKVKKILKVKEVKDERPAHSNDEAGDAIDRIREEMEAESNVSNENPGY